MAFEEGHCFGFEKKNSVLGLKKGNGLVLNEDSVLVLRKRHCLCFGEPGFKEGHCHGLEDRHHFVSLAVMRWGIPTN